MSRLWYQKPAEVWEEEPGGKTKQILSIKRSGEELLWNIQEIMYTAIRYTFEELLERHRRDYQSLFARVEFWLKGATCQNVICHCLISLKRWWKTGKGRQKQCMAAEVLWHITIQICTGIPHRRISGILQLTGSWEQRGFVPTCGRIINIRRIWNS